jgi:hypothetical protein
MGSIWPSSRFLCAAADRPRADQQNEATVDAELRFIGKIWQLTSLNFISSVGLGTQREF